MTSSWNEDKQTRRHFKLDLFDYAVELSQRVSGKTDQVEIVTMLREFASNCPHIATKQLYLQCVLNDHHHNERDVDLALGVHNSLLEFTYDDLSDVEQILKEINEAFEKSMKFDIRSWQVLKWCSIPFVIMTFILLSISGFWIASIVPVAYFVIGILLRAYIVRKKTLDTLEKVLVSSPDTTTEE